MLLLSLGLAARAAETSPGPDDVDAATGHRIVYQERTEIDFEGVKVQAELARPTGGIVFETRRTQFAPLIHLRRDWNDELRVSVDEVK